MGEHDRVADEQLDAWRASTVGPMLGWQFALSLPSAIGLTLATADRPGYRWVIVSGWSLLAGLLALVLARRLGWRTRARGLLAVFLGMMLISGGGLRPGPILFTYAMAMVALAGLLLGGRTAIAAAVVALCVVLALAGLSIETLGLRERPSLPLPQEWIAAVSGVSAPFVIVLIGIRRLLDRLAQAHADAVRALRELEATRERLVASEKAELVGRLAGGVAHDLNNTLTVIVAHADDLRSGKAADPVAEVGAQILEGARGAARLAQQLLLAGRRGVTQPRPVDLARAVEDMARAIRRLLPPGVTLEVDAPAPAWILVDPGHLHQTVLNLALNARDAMPDGGRLALAVRSARGAAGVPAAVLEVTDTGVGMDETVQARAFEPFFTTKEAGKGTGLGLANVRHVVEEAGGTIALRSAPGAGTTFALTFPAVAPVSAAPSTTGPGAARPGARILVVDDDIRVRALIVTALGDAGHRVEEAGHVDAALRVVEQAQGLDLLVTDLVMPGPPVTRLLAAFRARFPGAAVIACSAYSDDPEVRRSVFVGELALLAKPFERAELLAAVQAALRDATRLSATV